MLSAAKKQNLLRISGGDFASFFHRMDTAFSNFFHMRLYIIFIAQLRRIFQLPRISQTRQSHTENCLFRISCFRKCKQPVVFSIIQFPPVKALPVLSTGTIIMRLHDPRRRIFHRICVIFRKQDLRLRSLITQCCNDLIPDLRQNFLKTGLISIHKINLHLLQTASGKYPATHPHDCICPMEKFQIHTSIKRIISN